jgi:hypothetical protein
MLRGGINDASDDEDDFFGDEDCVKPTSSKPKSSNNDPTTRHVRQSGFRDGKAKEEEKVMQEGFDIGFEHGMVMGKVIGKLYALIRQTVLKECPNALPATGGGGGGKGHSPNTASSSSSSSSYHVQQSIRKNTELMELHKKFVHMILDNLPEAYHAKSPTEVPSSDAHHHSHDHEGHNHDHGHDHSSEQQGIDMKAVVTIVNEIFMSARTIIGKVYDMKEAPHNQGAITAGKGLLAIVISWRDSLDSILKE